MINKSFNSILSSLEQPNIIKGKGKIKEGSVDFVDK
jgi:hypothetical protein